jgi:hypothetical protein
VKDRRLREIDATGPVARAGEATATQLAYGVIPKPLGAAGDLFQGSGTFDAPETGLRVASAGADAGTGRITGYSGETEQWSADSAGIRAGGGAVTLDADGLRIDPFWETLHGVGNEGPTTIRFGLPGDASDIGHIRATKATIGSDDKVLIQRWDRTGANERTIQLTDGGISLGAGSNSLTVATTGLTIVGALTVPDGTASAPGLRLTSEAHGLYRASATALGFSVAGTSRATLSSTVLALGVQLRTLGQGIIIRDAGDTTTIAQISSTGTFQVVAGTFSGNVAINSATLTVAGARTSLQANSEAFALGLRYATGTGSFYLGASNSATPDLILSNNAGTERARLTNAGAFVLADGGNIEAGTVTGTKIGAATSQKVGFWNAAPVVQPTTAGAAATFAANTSGIANDTATFDGYTLGQIARALRTIGLLA